MLEFPGLVLELRKPVGRGTKGPLGHLWVQPWADNEYLNFRAFFRVLFDIISSSGRSLKELFLRSGNSPASVCPSNWPSVNISCYRISSKTGRIFFFLILKLGQNVPLSVQLCKYQNEFRSVDKHGRRRPSLIFLVISSETTWRIRMKCP